MVTTVPAHLSVVIFRGYTHTMTTNYLLLLICVYHVHGAALPSADYYETTRRTATFPTLINTDLDFEAHREAFRRLSLPRRLLAAENPEPTRTPFETLAPRATPEPAPYISTDRARVFSVKTVGDTTIEDTLPTVTSQQGSYSPAGTSFETLATKESTSTRGTTEPTPYISTDRAKVFSLKIVEDSSVDTSSTVTSNQEPHSGDYTIEGAEDICKNCPSLFMESAKPMTDQCSNADSLKDFFAMNIDARSANTVEKSDYVKCTRTVTCPEPHMLVKWLDSEICDLHAPTTVDGTNKFTYTCNGTHWTMHGYPIDSVICGSSA